MSLSTAQQLLALTVYHITVQLLRMVDSTSVTRKASPKCCRSASYSILLGPFRYVGNLDFSVTEEFIAMVFGQIGCIIKVRIIFDVSIDMPSNPPFFQATSDPYAFVEFADHQSATQALQTMNKRVLLNREMKVNWAAPGLRPSKMDSNRGLITN